MLPFASPDPVYSLFDLGLPADLMDPNSNTELNGSQSGGLTPLQSMEMGYAEPEYLQMFYSPLTANSAQESPASNHPNQDAAAWGMNFFNYGGTGMLPIVPILSPQLEAQVSNSDTPNSTFLKQPFNTPLCGFGYTPNMVQGYNPPPPLLSGPTQAKDVLIDDSLPYDYSMTVGNGDLQLYNQSLDMLGSYAMPPSLDLDNIDESQYTTNLVQSPSENKIKTDPDLKTNSFGNHVDFTIQNPSTPYFDFASQTRERSLNQRLSRLPNIKPKQPYYYPLTGPYSIPLYQFQFKNTGSDPLDASSYASSPTGANFAHTSHQLSKERQARKFPCKFAGCGLSFTRAYNMSTHYQTHFPDRKKPHECHVCERRFDRKHDLGRHLATVHKKKQTFPCTKCKTTFLQSDDLTNHLASSDCVTLSIKSDSIKSEN